MIKEFILGAKGWGEQLNVNFREIKERLQSTESGIQDVNTKVGELEETQQGINNKVVELEQRANPNLLINSNFKVSELVNQRGEKTYSGGWGYFCDMWRFYAGHSGHNANLENEYLRLSVVDGMYTCMQQKIEKLLKREVTLSSVIKGTAGERVELIINSNKKSFVLTGAWQHIFFTANINSEVDNVTQLWFYKVKGNSRCDVEYLKLEYGDEATPLIDDDPATKLAKCQRNLYVIQPESSNTVSVANGASISTGLVELAMYLPVAMRVTPAFTKENLGNGSMQLRGSGTNIDVTNATYTNNRKSSNIFFLIINGSFTQLETYTLFLSNYRILLSAEL